MPVPLLSTYGRTYGTADLQPGSETFDRMTGFAGLGEKSRGRQKARPDCFPPRR